MEAYVVNGYVYWDTSEMRSDGLFNDYIADNVSVEDYVYENYNFRDFIRGVLEDEIDRDYLYDNALDDCANQFWDYEFRDGWDVDWDAYPPKVNEYNEEIELMAYLSSGM